MFDFSRPTLGQPLGADRLAFYEVFRQACRHDILHMVTNAQSGHPGGALSALDMLATLYCWRLTHTDEVLVVSNGHISPAVYALLAECGVIDRDEVVANFRKAGHPYEGHVTRHVPGIWFGTGPLGVGVSAASGFALAEKLKSTDRHVWAMIGDGEAQEGQIHEMALFAAKENLKNFTVLVDFNEVQLTDSLDAIVPIDIPAIFRAHRWNVLEINGHDPEAIWAAYHTATQSDRPTCIVGQTVMGQGIEFMQATGEAKSSAWHGKAPKPDQAQPELDRLALTPDQEQILKNFQADRAFRPTLHPSPASLSPLQGLSAGTPRVYDAGTMTDCRSAYGAALADLAAANPTVLALTADVGGSVKTTGVKKDHPQQFIECGICEQQMVSLSGGLSLHGFVPFCSTFGAFMSSRAKDQARVNDINHANVKMVATHCGLSVGEDGPTHQAIDDMGSFLGMFDTHVIEPADANHCDRIIRYIGTHYGNFYVRMGRHKFPILLTEDGQPFFGPDYVYTYGRCDRLREGQSVTIVTSGALAGEALLARKASAIDAEIIIASSIKQFDDTLTASLRKTHRVITVEDHCAPSGLAAAVALHAAQQGIPLQHFQSVAVTGYQLSGTSAQLYAMAGIDSDGIIKALKTLP